MRKCTALLESIAPYFQSRYVGVPKLDRENPRDYEERTWRERVHTNDKGEVFIPATAFHKSVIRAAEMLSIKVPGKGQSTYTKHFRAGILVSEGIDLGIKKEDVQARRLLLNADGKRGGGKRVERNMPCIPTWKGSVTFYILDNAITNSLFEQHLAEAGLLVGIGQNRPENQGVSGRFRVVSCKWSEQ